MHNSESVYTAIIFRKIYEGVKTLDVNMVWGRVCKYAMSKMWVTQLSNSMYSECAGDEYRIFVQNQGHDVMHYYIVILLLLSHRGFRQRKRPQHKHTHKSIKNTTRKTRLRNKAAVWLLMEAIYSWEVANC